MPIHRHVQDQFFGAQEDTDGEIRPIDEEKLIYNLFENVPKLCSTDATIMSTIHYDSYYGIYDHRRFEEARPMGLMALHPAEDAFYTHPLFDCARNFHRGRISELFNISLIEYLRLPHCYIEILTELANEMNQEQLDTATDAERKVERELRRGGGSRGGGNQIP